MSMLHNSVVAHLSGQTGFSQLLIARQGTFTKCVGNKIIPNLIHAFKHRKSACNIFAYVGLLDLRSTGGAAVSQVQRWLPVILLHK